MKWRLPAGLVLFSVALVMGQTASSSRMFDSQTLLKDLQVLSADDMQGRRVDTPGGAKARAYIVQRFQASGVAPIGDTYLEPFTFVARGGRSAIFASETHGVNVVGQVSGNRRAGRYIVVSAHYDHLGVGNGGVFNGADDNASGTAALFTIAKYFSAHKPENALIIAAFDGEEAGLQGSRAFVASPPVKKEEIALDVNLDMIGRDPNDRLFAVGTVLNPFLKPYVLSVAAKAPLKLLIGHDDPTRKDEENWNNDSDQASFQRAGIPGLYLGVEDYSQHHKTTDDYATMTTSFYIRAVETSIALIETFDKNLDNINAARQGPR